MANPLSPPPQLWRHAAAPRRAKQTISRRCSHSLENATRAAKVLEKTAAIATRPKFTLPRRPQPILPPPAPSLLASTSTCVLDRVTLTSHSLPRHRPSIRVPKPSTARRIWTQRPFRLLTKQQTKEGANTIFRRNHHLRPSPVAKTDSELQVEAMVELPRSPSPRQVGRTSTVVVHPRSRRQERHPHIYWDKIPMLVFEPLAT
ncbi:hypothetical protein DL93DRAFT_2171209 [Clavulina sp. PMI_390]|nr:hypothetical protein DL93DRAFT_2171209 [Clavulina sp. PMI_390]